MHLQQRRRSNLDDSMSECSDTEEGTIEGGGLIQQQSTDEEDSSELDDDTERLEKGVFETEVTSMTLNREFAVPFRAKETWDAELEGGVCDAFCVNFDDDDPAGGCHKLTACVCGKMLGAERLGNMPVLYAKRRVGKPTQLMCIMGPFWPCMIGVTFPLICGVSLFASTFLFRSCPVWVIVIWFICTGTLLFSLAMTGCTNPGIVRRYEDQPPSGSVGWRWSDQAQTFRPPKSTYDRDCGVVIEEFDHTCPWTGTGIGKSNMPYFTTFVSLICICLIFDVMLMVGVFEPIRESDP